MAVTLNVYPAEPATGYISLADFQAYCGQRLLDITNFTDDQLKAAVIKATDYMDARFKFHGFRAEKGQPLEWPRTHLVDARGDRIDLTIPKVISDVCAEYAFRALRIDLMPDPSSDAYGQAVKSRTEKVGPISESVQYETHQGIVFAKFPVPDGKLLRSGLTWNTEGSLNSLDIGRA